jgi:hypothetical protein
MLWLLQCLDGESSSGESPLPQIRSIGQFLLSRLFSSLHRSFLRSGFSWVSNLVWWLLHFWWTTSCTYDMPRSACSVVLETYHGASTIILKILDWLLWIIDMLDLLVQPHNSRPYVQIGIQWILVISPTYVSFVHVSKAPLPLGIIPKLYNFFSSLRWCSILSHPNFQRLFVLTAWDEEYKLQRSSLQFGRMTRHSWDLRFNFLYERKIFKIKHFIFSHYARDSGTLLISFHTVGRHSQSLSWRDSLPEDGNKRWIRS